MRFYLFLLLAGTAYAYPGIAYHSEEIDSNEHGQHVGTKSTNCSCGWTNKVLILKYNKLILFQRRIVGGKETLKNEYPLMAGIVFMHHVDIFCGATILTKNHALTASHCTVPFKGRELGLVVGGHNKEMAYEESEVIPIKYTIEHERYDNETLSYDIALLVLEDPITFNQFVGPACLPNKRIELVNEQIKVLGWGYQSRKGDPSDVLMKVDLKVFPITFCQAKYKKKIETENPYQICTYRTKKDSCKGDSGGPLLWLDPETNRYTVVALVSYGKKSCASKSPAVNTEVAFFLDWIQEKIASTGLDGLTCAKQ